MSISAIKSIPKVVNGFIRANLPMILTASAVGGVFMTGFMAAGAAPKASEILRAHRENHFCAGDGEVTILPDKKLSKTEIIKLTWKLYMPAIAMGAATIACIIGANKVNLRRSAALASAYSLAETTLKAYQEKVVETIGEKKEQAIRDGIAQDQLNANGITGQTIIFGNGGDILCYESLSGRYFKSDYETLRKAMNDFNRDLRAENWKSVDEWYDLINLPHTRTGRDLGWGVDWGLNLEFSTNLSEDRRPCLVVNYRDQPRVESFRY
jgi:hypothetical protein